MKDVIGKLGAVAAPDAYAANVGAQVLRQGGNAVDAAVAAVLVECVVQPHNLGLGGYAGTMVLHLADPGRVVALDFDAVAPLAASPDMYPIHACTDNWDVESDGQSGPPGLNEHGSLCVTAPTIVAGLAMALERFGTMSFADLARPAAVLARSGFPVYPELAKALSLFASHADSDSVRALLPSGGAPKEGEMLVQPDLARLLDLLADEGPEAFYHGDVPRKIARALHDKGGILCEEDFAAVTPRLEEPLSVRCGECEVFTPAPPAAGLTALQVLRAAEIAGMADSDFGSPAYYNLLIELARHAWSDRIDLFGDPLFADVPIADLLSRRRAENVLSAVHAGAVQSRVGMPVGGGGHTVHLATVDDRRNMVSVTATHGSWFGSMVVIPGLGLVLGNGMSRFDPAPARPNSIAPGKRVQHNMSPLVITRNGRPYCAIGLPGGRKIPNVSALLAHAIARFGLTCGQAMDLPRFHVEGPILSLSKGRPAYVDSEGLASGMKREFGEGCQVRFSKSRLGGPVVGVMVAAETDHLLAASENGPDCVGVV